MVEDVEEDETEESEDDFYTSDIDPDWSKTPLMRRKRPNVSIFILPKKRKTSHAVKKFLNIIKYFYEHKGTS